VFWNVSYFDKEFFNGMFGDFMFPDFTKPDWESLNWVQKKFMTWFNEERLKTMLTFPVESFALVYKDGKFVDEESARFVSEEYARGHSFFTYISDTVDSLSSCCFDYNTKIKFKSETGAIIDEKIGYLCDNFNEITICSLNPHTCERKYLKAETIKTFTKEWIIIEYYDNHESIKVTPDHIFPIERENGQQEEVFAKDIKTGDKLILDNTDLSTINSTCSLGWREVKSVSHIKLDVEEPCYCVKVIDESSPYFVLSDRVITHNCRLKNAVTTKEFNFTNGNMGVQTGSKSVITLNLNRIIQNSVRDTNKVSDPIKYEDFDKKALVKYLNKILGRVYKYHVAYNELLWEMKDAHLLTVYDAGFIDLNKQYLTIGINGLNQAAEFVGLECNNNEGYKDFCKLVFSTITSFIDSHKKEEFGHQITLNCEQVPAESLAVKNYNWDKEGGYWVPEDTNLYASYIFKPNDPNITVLDKIILHSKEFAAEELSGGQAAHINLSEHLTKEQYWKILNFAGEVGCSYFTFNIPNSECDDCGYITKEPITECPRCHSKRISLYDRIIGYLTKIKNWSKGRQIEQKTRIYTKPEEND